MTEKEIQEQIAALKKQMAELAEDQRKAQSKQKKLDRALTAANGVLSAVRGGGLSLGDISKLFG
jgi:DNA repair exonuclease SbcCD ATPase subunit